MNHENNGSLICQECGLPIVWGPRKHRWTHRDVEDDHDITIGKAKIPASDVDDKLKVDPQLPVPDLTEPFTPRIMIGEPLEGLNNIGTTGTLDGETDQRHNKRTYVSQREMIDEVWAQIGGK